MDEKMNPSEEIYQSYFSALIKGNRHVCSDIVNKLLAQNIAIRDVYINLFQRSMYEIGTLWETNKISVAIEHVATSITAFQLSLIYPTLFSRDHINKSAVVACVANEFHQIGGQMAADIFELHGWDSYFLGSNTPVTDLVTFIGEKRPDIVGLSLSIYSNQAALLETIREIKQAFPMQKIIMGGQAFNHGSIGVAQGYTNVSHVESLAALEDLLK